MHKVDEPTVALGVRWIRQVGALEEAGGHSV